MEHGMSESIKMAVKSPKHYTEGRKYEPKDVIRDWGLNFNLGSALKYISRAGRKDDVIQDLEKAREYLAFEIEAVKSERARTQADGLKRAVKPDRKDGCKCGVINLEVPEGLSTEDIIKLAISKIMGVDG